MPGLVKVSWYGAGGDFGPALKTRINPELRTSAVLEIVDPPCCKIASGLIASTGAFPDHQKG